MSHDQTLTASLSDAHTLNGLRLRNRTVLAPMTRVSANPDGTVTPEVAEYYRIFAAGGFGALVTEGSYIDFAHSQTYLNQAGLASDEHTRAWRRVVEGVHAEGAAILAQLQHAGPQLQGNPHATGARGPSAISAKGNQLSMYGGSGPYQRPEALTIDEIAEVRGSFVAAAVRARDAGFDGVEVHGANGYLLDAFLTDYLNQRDDRYGGSPTHRVRLAVEIVQDIRAELGDGFVVGVRVSQGKVSDGNHKWSGSVEEARTILGALAGGGADYIHTTDASASAPAFPDDDPRSLAALARECAPGLTIIANGDIASCAQAERLLAGGPADLVSIGRAALSNRDWPTRTLQGQPLAAPFEPSNFGERATVQGWETDAAELLKR